MFYLKKDNFWFCGKKVVLPTSPPTELNESNKVNDYGWNWHDTPPQEYLDWIEEQEEEQEPAP